MTTSLNKQRRATRKMRGGIGKRRFTQRRRNRNRSIKSHLGGMNKHKKFSYTRRYKNNNKRTRKNKRRLWGGITEEEKKEKEEKKNIIEGFGDATNFLTRPSSGFGRGNLGRNNKSSPPVVASQPPVVESPRHTSQPPVVASPPTIASPRHAIQSNIATIPPTVTTSPRPASQPPVVNENPYSLGSEEGSEEGSLLDAYVSYIFIHDTKEIKKIIEQPHLDEEGDYVYNNDKDHDINDSLGKFYSQTNNFIDNDGNLHNASVIYLIDTIKIKLDNDKEILVKENSNDTVDVSSPSLDTDKSNELISKNIHHNEDTNLTSGFYLDKIILKINDEKNIPVIDGNDYHGIYDFKESKFTDRNTGSFSKKISEQKMETDSIGIFFKTLK